MNQAEIEQFVASLENVQRTENYGYSLFFIGDDHLIPFVSLNNSDNEYDNVSNLDRAGVFRVNIGVSRQTFNNLIGPPNAEAIDYSLLNSFLPHPHYAKQNFICILNPANENAQTTKQLIHEAHGLAAVRFQRKEKH